MFSLEKVEKPLVLLCFRSKVLKKQWLYCVFAQKYWKSIGFIVFSLKSVEKALVLRARDDVNDDMQKNHWFYWKNIFLLIKYWMERYKTNVKPSGYGFGPWPCNTRLDKLWGTLTAKLFREPLVLLCFRSNILNKPLVLRCFPSRMLKNHWFYCVFAQNC